ncbi:MAG TPA: hypothetical protein VKH13_11220 [Steroidobacteraceae bacterium]|nr:hypothetical protein [Steroidobacteraceae bacterium]
MALISRPDPMPVEVISALALVGAVLAAVDALLGAIVELIGVSDPALWLLNLSAIQPKT